MIERKIIERYVNKFSHDKNNTGYLYKAAVSFSAQPAPAMYTLDVMGGAWVTWHHPHLIVDPDWM